MILHCITIPSKTHITGRAILYSSICQLSKTQTIDYFLESHSERSWEDWVNIHGYDCVPLFTVSHLLMDRLRQDKENYHDAIKG